jgi:sec-independent protein translocase protein TatC
MASAPDSNKKRRIPRHEREMEVMEHLAELRTRLLRCVGVILIACCIVWFYYLPIYHFFTAPFIHELAKHGGHVVFSNWLEGFFIRMKISMYGGIVVSAPFWILEMWGFVSPALTPEERRPIRYLAPLTIVLFAMGVILAHLILPMAFRWAMGYIPPDVELLQHVNDYIELLAKMYLAFGLCFELPIVLMFLAWTGIINANLMRQYWRQAVLIIMVVAAIVTPSNDPITMLMCAIPMAILYLMSIVLVDKTIAKR